MLGRRREDFHCILYRVGEHVIDIGEPVDNEEGLDINRLQNIIKQAYLIVEERF